MPHAIRNSHRIVLGVSWQEQEARKLHSYVADLQQDFRDTVDTLQRSFLSEAEQVRQAGHLIRFLRLPSCCWVACDEDAPSADAVRFSWCS
jgi:hypothetical protein